MLKLGIRLKQIEALVAPDYHHIWDCCCDHGLLGTSLLHKQAAPHIHFVDIVPELITSLTQRLETHFTQNPNPNLIIQRSQWHTHCLDIARLPLEIDSMDEDKQLLQQRKHLVIIAGIGGELMAQCVNDIATKHSNLAIDFLLCPVHHTYTLREQLISLNMGLIKEVLIKENNRFYEILYVSNRIANSTPQIQNISHAGESIWTPTEICKTEDIQDYLKITLKHYLRTQSGMNKSPPLKTDQSIRLEHIIKAYQTISDKLQ